MSLIMEFEHFSVLHHPGMTLLVLFSCPKEEKILQQLGEIMKERLILKCDQVPRVTRSTPHMKFMMVMK